MALLDLHSGDYNLRLAPEMGGAIASFDWRGKHVFRPTCGPSMLETACFPLAPFSNRIAFGRFEWGQAIVQLRPNFPGRPADPHTIHGFGWQYAWEIVEAGTNQARIRHEYHAGEWPWSYAAEQHFELSEAGLTHGLRLRNLSDTPMPGGLGVHPYFERTAKTIYHGLHRGEWKTSSDGLPVELQLNDNAVDWWHGAPVDSRCVDTVYADREGPLTISWPERNLQLLIDPCDALSFTTVYTPPEQNIFCVEAVSQMTDAINRSLPNSGLRILGPGEAMQVSVRYKLSDYHG